MTSKKNALTVHKHGSPSNGDSKRMDVSIVNNGLLTNEQLIRAFRTMYLARSIDEKSMILLKQGKILFHISGPGHEACQIATAMAMKPGYDWAYPYYRDLAFALQYGSTAYEIFLESMHRI